MGFGLESFRVRIFGFQLVLLVLCLCLSSAFAQTRHKPAAKALPPSAFQLISVKVTGTKRYKPEDVIAATGLQLHDTVGEDDFRKAVRILGETGAFGDV